MPTHITQLEDADHNRTILRVDGELLLDDASLLERIAGGLLAKNRGSVTIDLADLDFIDSDAAPVMKRLQDVDGVEITGMEIFLQNVVNDAERQHG
jgi:anti-anti-sigma regulatory factor